MIILKPIDVEVQKTINDKIRQSSKVDGVGYIENRTTWARMISLSKIKDRADQPIVISAGLEETQPVADNSNLQPIRGRLIGAKDDVYRGTYNRPIPGLKSITTQTQGNYKATRTADVRWICWDFETLERLTPYFLTPGASIAVEFGWMWDGHKPQEFIYDSWGTLDAKAIGDLSNGIRKFGKGNQDLVYGVVKDFEWTGRDDGGFDCTTKIVSIASNIFGMQATSEEGDGDVTAFEISDELANQIRPHRNMFQRRKGELSDVLEDDNLTNKLSKFGLGVDKGIDEKFIEKVTPELLYSNITDILKDIALDRSQGGKGRKRPEYENTILLEYDFGDDEWLGPYVSYGWFEDNLLLPFVSAVNGKNELTFKVRSVEKVSDDGKFRSIRVRNDVNNLLTMNATEVIIPGQWPMDVNFQQIDREESGKTKKTKDSEKYTATRQAYMRLAKKVAELPVFSTKSTNRSEVDILRNGYKILNSKINQVAEDTTKDEGYMRNLLINTKMIEEELGSAASFEDGLNNLLGRISSACGGIWDFKIAEADDGQTLRVVEESSTEKPVRDLLDNKNLEPGGNLSPTYQNDGLVVFPAWQTNSIVYNQQLTARLPSNLQVAAIYGKFGSTEEIARTNETLSAKGKKFGELFNPALNEDSDSVDDILFQNLRRVIGNSEFTKIGYNKLPDADGTVGEITVSGKEGIQIDYSAVIKYYTEQQILDILNDGIPYDKEKDPEAGDSFWEKAVAIFKSEKLDYKYLYSDDGKIRKHYKEAMNYFLREDRDSIQQTRDVTVPLDLEVTIDGTGGIYSGEAFSSSYIPKKYLDSCVFQVMDVSHQLDPSGWKTTLKGLMRIDNSLGNKTKISDEKLFEEGKARTNVYKNFMDYLNGNIGKKSKYRAEVVEIQGPGLQ